MRSPSSVGCSPFISALCMAALLLTAARPAWAEEKGDMKEARKYFEMGVGYLEDPDGERVEEAYRAFTRAYELSKSPKILGNIGLCSMRLERDGEAIDAYSEYLRSVPDIDPPERAQIERDLSTLSASVVRVTITVSRPNVLIVDSHVAVRGGTVTNAYGPVRDAITIRLRQGHHVIKAKLDGAERGIWEFDARPGLELRHRFDVAAAPAASPRREVVHPAAWILTGVGAAALTAGAVVGIGTQKSVSEMDTQCPRNICPPTYDLQGKRDSTRTLATVTNGLLIGGGVVTATGLTWLLIHGLSQPERKQERPKPWISGGAACLPGVCAMRLELRL